MTRVLLHLIAGALGGLAVWLIAEPVPWLTSDDRQFVDLAAMSVLGAMMGLGIGGALGAAEGLSRGSTRQAWNYALGGMGLGLLGGFLGIYLGQSIYGPWTEFNRRLEAFGGAALPVVFFSGIMARTVGWACIGLFIGLATGLLIFSPRRLSSGAVGGLIGGALGGFCFEIIARIVQVPELSRGIGFTLVGAGTGLGISLAHQLAKQAWVRVVMGRNEGRDYLLEKESNILGRDEMADVPLFGDPAIGKHHAFILRKSGIWHLRDAGSPAGTLVNGSAVQERPLQEGDRIAIGRYQLEFHSKGGQAIPVPERDAAPAKAPQAVPSSACAFCGVQKHPITGACACTPLGQPAPAPAGGGPIPITTANPPIVGSGGPASSVGVVDLVVTSGPYAGQRFAVSGSASIGRQEGNTIALPADPSVSRRHATLAPAPSGLQVRDEGSSNGTFVNGRRVTDATLRPGDELQVGETRMRLA
ncbi:MAG: FHA domain-containing protein [Armatimonadetes bacterium]|nr:FHA domain-containing protein [Armatimonadota bacterium]